MLVKNKKALVTGSLGLIGFETTLLLLKQGYSVIGVDNDLRAKLFHITTKYKEKLRFFKKNYNSRYWHFDNDIRNTEIMDKIYKTHEGIEAVIHTAGQTSHEWSYFHPQIDFSINAWATLYLLEKLRKYVPKAIFIFTSTNKVYGDKVNSLKFKVYKQRYDLPSGHQYFAGINEDFPIDKSLHSIFGVSKASADLLTQEYGRYYGLKTAVLRLGVVSGGGQSGAEEQGFLVFMLNKLIRDEKFRVIGYQGKQVRDIIDARDVARAIFLLTKDCGRGEVFNLGGGRENAASIRELIEKVQALTGKKMRTTYVKTPRLGDHKWWITDTRSFKKKHPSWKINYSLNQIIKEIYDSPHDIFR